MTLFFNTILLEKESVVSDEDPEKSLWKGLRIDYYEQYVLKKFEIMYITKRYLQNINV